MLWNSSLNSIAEFYRRIPSRNLIVEFSVACQFSKRATKACYRLSFEISQWNSTPQIHNQNSVLKSRGGILFSLW
ncbi:hypothetical protein [uncultured Campylobacter sp.]|uniref:hypothetical protein n=1 Tax=uncultured Campylobacter sp. TaxID=218934 RepID=UPI00262E431B|nr:hypothetical protein [uncultured Campylobacter sp.]